MKGYESKTKNEQARRFYQGFIKTIYFDMAHSHERKNDFKKANDLYNKALVLDPLDSVIHNNIGLNFVRLNQMERAEDYFRTALELDPMNYLAKNNLATYYAVQKRNEEALILFEELLEADPNNQAVLNNYYRLKNASETN